MVVVVIAKVFFEAAEFAYANKTKDYTTSHKLGLCDFRRIANWVLSKGKSALTV